MHSRLSILMVYSKDALTFLKELNYKPISKWQYKSELISSKIHYALNLYEEITTRQKIGYIHMHLESITKTDTSEIVSYFVG